MKINDLKFVLIDLNKMYVYPVREINFVDSEICIKTRDEVIEDIKAAGGHYCDNCGGVHEEYYFCNDEKSSYELIQVHKDVDLNILNSTILDLKNNYVGYISNQIVEAIIKLIENWENNKND